MLAQLLLECIETYINEERIAPQSPVAFGMLRTADLVVLRPPDGHWLINVIGILNADHAIFQRDYIPPRAQTNRIQNAILVANNDNFFDNLPPLTGQQLQHRALALPKSAQIQ